MIDVSGETSNHCPTAEQHFGGFPGPISVAQHVMRHYAPKAYRRLERKLTFIPGHVVHPTDVNNRQEEKKRTDAIPRASEGSDDGSSMHFSDIQKAATEMHSKFKDYIRSGTLWIGRNSFFDLDGLTDEQIEEVGGVEYTALTILAWLVPAVRLSLLGNPLPSALIYSAIKVLCWNTTHMFYCLRCISEDGSYI
jgi:hypothetical protein